MFTTFRAPPKRPRQISPIEDAIADIKAGKHQFTVISVLGDNWGASSDQFVVTVPAGAQPPAAPVVTGVIDNVGPIQGLIKPNGTTDDPRPAITAAVAAAARGGGQGG